MIFSSLQFVAFFAVVFCVLAVLSWRGSVRLRNAVLLLASYAFYASWDWRFLGLIITSTLVDYACARAIAATPERPGAERRRRNLLLVSVCTNLGILGFFKYFGFFVGSAVELLTALGFDASGPGLHIILPVGISFYTFQTLGYTIDVHRGRVEAESSLLDFATFVAFFPQLVAGPIERAAKLLPQFKQPTRLSVDDLSSGLYLLAFGLFKKVVIADNLAPVADAAFALDSATGAQVLVGTWAFAIQIYCDFSGYSDAAKGIARSIGFDLSWNFEHPYFAANPAEFWRRWHITLSSWLRDYFYLGLGGAAHAPYRKLFLTMLLSGLWHGAAWHFVIWGAYHGLLVCGHRAFEVARRKRAPDRRKPKGALRRALYAFGCFQLVALGWPLFRADSTAHAWSMLSSLASGLGPDVVASLDVLGPVPLAAVLTLGLIAYEVVQFRRNDPFFVMRLSAPLRAVAYATGFLSFVFLGEYGGDAFIYFQF